jgi:TNF receptor-associated factor 4
MCLRVYANGSSTGRGTHLSVFVCVMKGEFDDQLKWPFRGKISIRLVNREKDKDHIVKILWFTEDVLQSCQRVMTVEPSAGQGNGRFFPHTELQPKYLKNDCIKLFIKKLQIF